MDKYISNNITEEFFNALTNFADGYISSIKVSIFSHASEIADDDMLRTLLLEYNRRKTKYNERAAMDARNIILYGMTLSDSTFNDFCLNHASSYHDVIADMLKAKNFFH